MNNISDIKMNLNNNIKMEELESVSYYSFYLKCTEFIVNIID